MKVEKWKVENWKCFKPDHVGLHKFKMTAIMAANMAANKIMILHMFFQNSKRSRSQEQIIYL